MMYAMGMAVFGGYHNNEIWIEFNTNKNQFSHVLTYRLYHKKGQSYAVQLSPSTGDEWHLS